MSFLDDAKRNFPVPIGDKRNFEQLLNSLVFADSELLRSVKTAQDAKTSTSFLNKPIAVGKFGGYDSGYSDGTHLMATYQWSFIAPYDTYGVQLVFGNWSLGQSAGGSALDSFGTNKINIVGVSMYNMGQFSFNGAASTSILPGATVFTDVLPAKLVAGTSYAIAVCVSVNTLGDKWPLGMTTGSTGASYGEGVVYDADKSVSFGISAGTALGYHPIAIIGNISKPSKKTIGLAGDSIILGIGETTPDKGWAARGLNNANLPWFRMAKGGGSMAGNLADNKILTITHLAGADFIITNFGANDMNSFANLAAAKAAYLNYWSIFKSFGSKVLQSTILPRIDFTTAGRVLKNTLNDWFRDGAPIINGVGVDSNTLSAIRMGDVNHPLYKIIEIADLAETARNSDVWKTGYTVDFVHPTTVGAIALSAAINPNDFI